MCSTCSIASYLIAYIWPSGGPCSLNSSLLTLCIFFFIPPTIALCYNCAALPHLWMPITGQTVQTQSQPCSGLRQSFATLKQKKHRDITCHWIEVKSWIIPRAAESEIMRQPNYADNYVAVSPLCGVSDTDKCLLRDCSGSLSHLPLSGREVLRLRATEFYYGPALARVWGRRATIGKMGWDEIKTWKSADIFPFSALLHL